VHFDYISEVITVLMTRNSAKKQCILFQRDENFLNIHSSVNLHFLTGGLQGQQLSNPALFPVTSVSSSDSSKQIF